MKLIGRSRNELIKIFTSPSTPAGHAERLVDRLIAEKVDDTNDVPFDRWAAMLNPDAPDVPPPLAPEGDYGVI